MNESAVFSQPQQQSVLTCLVYWVGKNSEAYSLTVVLIHISHIKSEVEVFLCLRAIL